jgi:hypothetical protein
MTACTHFLRWDKTERGRVVSTPASYSGVEVPGSNFGLETGYHDWGFRGFPQSLQEMPGQYPKLGHDRFLPHPFQFIIRYHPVILWSELLKASWNELWDYTVLQPRRQPSSYSPPWEPQILLSNYLWWNTPSAITNKEQNWPEQALSLLDFVTYASVCATAHCSGIPCKERIPNVTLFLCLYV